MAREGLVQDVAVQLDGQTYQASYFVENGTIHAQLQDQTYLLPLGGEAAAQMVKSLLLEKVRRKGFRQALARKWFRQK